MNKLKKCIIAEKPSLGRNIASAINEEFKKGDGFLESEGYIVTWAFGHLFGLINLEEYDKNYNIESRSSEGNPTIDEELNLDSYQDANEVNEAIISYVEDNEGECTSETKGLELKE